MSAFLLHLILTLQDLLFLAKTLKSEISGRV